MINECQVSVICSIFNQKDYIARAIESILKQKAGFDYEILIHDDASYDGSYEIIQGYAEKDNKIRIIREQQNQYSQGIPFLDGIIRNEARGSYIALCEGDDFWIDDNKLQLQFEALESHPECDMCACWGCTVTERGENEVSQIRPMKQNGILNIENVILGGGQYLVTAGLFFRRDMFNDMMGLSNLDYAMQIRGAIRGGIYYLDRKMAVYRRYSKGSWTNNVLKDNEKLKIQWEKEIELLRTFDNSTDGKYHDTILERLKAYTTFEEQLESEKEQIISLIAECRRPVFIWGLGRRGRSLEEFLKKEKVVIDGVCDAINENIESVDAAGFPILHTDEVIMKAKTILASTRWAYDDLKDMGLKADVYDMQRFMPLG